MSKANWLSANDIKNAMLVNELKKYKENEEKNSPNIDSYHFR